MDNPALVRDRLFIAMTRPQMFGGVTYGFFVANGIVATEIYVVSRSLWALVVAVAIHAIGAAICQHDPRAFDIIVVRARGYRHVPGSSPWSSRSYGA